MAKCFRSDNLKQDLLLPPSLRDWLPEKHLAHFLVDVVESLDLGAIYRSYEEKDGRGQAAYAPTLMMRLLLYGYCTGTYSSRKIENKTYEDVAFRYLAADEHPDHDTIAEFRKRHLEALAGLFVQVLQLCQKAGLVKLGHVAIDGSKIQANASKHKAMSYERLGETEKKLREEVEALLEQAAAVDGQAQMIVAAERTQDTNDTQQLAPMLGQVQENTGSKPQAASADTGYWNSQQMADARLQGVDLYIATGKQKHGEERDEREASVAEAQGSVSVREQMKQKLRSEAGQAVYRRRKAIVEPVFGQIKEGRGFRRFFLRGLQKVRAEWKLICLSHNILKLFRSGTVVPMAQK